MPAGARVLQGEYLPRATAAPTAAAQDPQLQTKIMAALAAGDYSTAFKLGAGNKYGEALLTPQGYQALGGKPMTSEKQMADYYNAFLPYAASYHNPILGQMLGAGSRFGINAQSNWTQGADLAFNLKGQNTNPGLELPNIAAYASRTPGKTFLDQYGANIAELALGLAVPGIGAALGGALGVGTTAGTALAGAGVGAGEAALTGGNPLTGAVLGGLGGAWAGSGAGQAISSGVSQAFGGGAPGSIAGNVASGVVKSGVTGAVSDALGSSFRSSGPGPTASGTSTSGVSSPSTGGSTGSTMSTPANQLMYPMSGAGSVGNTPTPTVGAGASTTPAAPGSGAATLGAGAGALGAGSLLGPNAGGLLGDIQTGAGQVASALSPSNLFSTTVGQSNLLQGIGPYAAIAGVGLSQADQAKKDLAAQTGQVAALGQPYVSAGQDLLKQFQSGTLTPAQQKVVDTATSQGNTLLASDPQLQQIYTQAFGDYASGTLRPADQLALDQKVAAQKQQVASALAQQGITDSSILAGQNQQIDNQATILKQQLLDAQFQTGNQAFDTWSKTTQAGQQLILQGQQYAVSSLNNTLQQALGTAATGIDPIMQSIQMQIAGDAQISASVSDLLGNLAKGYAVSQYNSGQAARAGTSTAGTGAGGAAAGAAKAATGGGGTPGTTTQNADGSSTTTNPDGSTTTTFSDGTTTTNAGGNTTIQSPSGPTNVGSTGTVDVTPPTTDLGQMYTPDVTGPTPTDFASIGIDPTIFGSGSTGDIASAFSGVTFP